MSAWKIIKRASFHARIILLILYWEKKYQIKLPFKILRKLINQGMYHCEIHPDSFTSLSAIVSCRLPHPFLIVVHRSARIGEGCTIYHGVTLGAIEQKARKGPTLGDGVYIGCNASVLGNIRVGDEVAIGAHALVLKDVDHRKRVTGVYK